MRPRAETAAEGETAPAAAGSRAAPNVRQPTSERASGRFRPARNRILIHTGPRPPCRMRSQQVSGATSAS
eukprot:1518576-Alexandrium_andersonii.AAC.1